MNSRALFAGLLLAALVATLRGKEDTVGRLALQFVILTAARSGEVRGATWAEMDIAAATWTVPANRMKAGRIHSVPLSAPALRTLETVGRISSCKPDALVFAGTAGRMLSDMTMTKALRDAGATATVHGFRSSFRAALSGLSRA